MRSRKNLGYHGLAGILLGTGTMVFAAPLEVMDALERFQVEDGLRVELVAGEPLVSSPCALAWDQERRLYVVENQGYPTGMPDGSLGGRVVRLTDEDGDGQLDHRQIWADGFSFPNGIMAWKDGFLITCAPDIWFLKDADEDGVAEIKQKWVTGYNASNTTQLRVSHPTLGPDGWVYLTSGLVRSPAVYSPLHVDNQPLAVSGDSRFSPWTGQVEAIDGRGQFGQTFDDFGNRFHCMNRIHIQHVVLESAWVDRNPNVQYSQRIQNVPEEMLDDGLRGVNPAARIYPISDNLTTADSHAGTFSAACGVMVIRGTGLGEGREGSILTCDPTGNLVHQDVLIPKGPTFQSRMARPGKEFLASSDNWFRPVFLAQGPDGSLYICDMYRQTIEHPQYLPEEVRNRTDFNAGRNLGRIWKVSDPSSSLCQEEMAEKDRMVRAGDWDTLLGDREGWWRSLAHRKLLEKAPTCPDEGALPEWSGESWAEQRGTTLQGLASWDHRRMGWMNVWGTRLGISGAIREDHGTEELEAEWHADRDRFAGRLLQATTAESAGVRLVAWRWLGKVSGSPGVLDERLLEYWKQEPHAQVRFLMAIALGNWVRQESGCLRVLVEILLRDGEDPWARVGVLSGVKGMEPVVIRDYVDAGGRSRAVLKDLARLEALTLRREWEFSRWMMSVRFEDSIQISLVQSYSQASTKAQIEEWMGELPEVWALWKKAALQFLHSKDALEPEFRLDLARFLRVSWDGRARRGVVQRLVRADSAEERAAWIGTLFAGVNPEQALKDLMKESVWSALDLEGRRLVMREVLQNPSATGALLKGLEEGEVSAGSLVLEDRKRLLDHADPMIREKAQAILGGMELDRMKVYEGLKGVAGMSGDSGSGKILFEKNCAACHRLDRVGIEVGPDLFGVRNQTKEALLLHILVPNWEVIPGFEGHEVELVSGEWLSGLLVEETSEWIRLRQASGLVETLERKNIRSRRVSARSLMPDGFEAVMQEQELADLLSFLKGE